MEKLLFITETIRDNFIGDNLLYAENFIAEAITINHFTLTNSGNYFLTNNEPKKSVKGFVYQVTELTIRRLDLYQDSPTWCYRKEIPVIDEHGKELTTWVYLDDAIEIFQKLRIA